MHRETIFDGAALELRRSWREVAVSRRAGTGVPDRGQRECKAPREDGVGCGRGKERTEKGQWGWRPVC